MEEPGRNVIGRKGVRGKEEREEGRGVMPLFLKFLYLPLFYENFAIYG